MNGLLVFRSSWRSAAVRNHGSGRSPADTCATRHHRKSICITRDRLTPELSKNSLQPGRLRAGCLLAASTEISPLRAVTAIYKAGN